MTTIYFQFIRLSYLELIPSVSISAQGVMFSWLVWGFVIQWGEVEEDDNTNQ